MKEEKFNNNRDHLNGPEAVVITVLGLAIIRLISKILENVNNNNLK